MVVDVGIVGRGTTSVPKRPAVVAFDRSKMDRQTSNLILECRHQASKYKADLDAALGALKCANVQIDRLNAEVESAAENIAKKEGEIAKLKAELQAERDRNAKKKSAQKTQQKSDCTESDE